MVTELEIVYSILNTVRDAEHNNDEPVTERLMRSFLNTYRVDALRKYYKDGHVVDDEVFQLIPLKLSRIGNTHEFKGEIPKIIRLTNHYGFYLEKNGISIPIVDLEQYSLSKRNPFASHLVQSKTQQNTLTLFGGLISPNINGTQENGILIANILDEVEAQVNSSVTDIKVNVDFFGILTNPSDQPGYDWEKDIYPFPSEKLEELKSQILRKEFGIMMQAKKDEIANSRNDSLNAKDERQIDG